MKRKKILLTFNGDRDPDFISPGTEEKLDGPIMTLLALHEFDNVELFFTPDKNSSTEITAAAILKRFSSIIVNLQPVNLPDPTSYRDILSEVRRCTASILQTEDTADYYISLSSGTPHMHASWLLLAASGEIPAKLLHVRDPRRIEKGQKPYVEIDPRSSWFPHIAAVIPTPSNIHPSLNVQDIQAAIRAAGICGSQETIENIINTTAKAARSDESIMILGESGTGKELLANFIYYMSKRCDKTIVAINVTSIPENLIESELFGHEKGAFTGADKRKIGRFEQAHQGTIFLDEVGDMSLSMQVKILRAIQEKKIYRLGGTEPIDVDIRIIAATNRDLPELIKKELFREDLYYRISVITVTLKPLRERRQDIGILADYFVKIANGKNNTEKRLTTEALQKLQQYHWPGNIREMRNVIERAHINTYDKEISIQDIIFDNMRHDQNDLPQLPEFYDGFNLEEYCRKIHDALVTKALQQSKTKSDAARLLGVSPPALSKKKN